MRTAPSACVPGVTDRFGSELACVLRSSPKERDNTFYIILIRSTLHQGNIPCLTQVQRLQLLC
jgi:hypothetical protein